MNELLARKSCHRWQHLRAKTFGKGGNRIEGVGVRVT